MCKLEEEKKKVTLRSYVLCQQSVEKKHKMGVVKVHGSKPPGPLQHLYMEFIQLLLSVGSFNFFILVIECLFNDGWDIYFLKGLLNYWTFVLKTWFILTFISWD